MACTLPLQHWPGADTQHEAESGQPRLGGCGYISIGDFLSVKWRDKATRKEHEDRGSAQVPAPIDTRPLGGEGGVIGLDVAAHTMNLGMHCQALA